METCMFEGAFTTYFNLMMHVSSNKLCKWAVPRVKIWDHTCMFWQWKSKEPGCTVALVHFWLHHTVHCAVKIVSTCWVTCTWRLLGLAVKGPWLRPGAWTGFRKHYLLLGCLFLSRKAAWALSGCMTADRADHCMLVNKWGWSRSWVRLLRLEVDLGSVLESELGQRYGQVYAKRSLKWKKGLNGSTLCLTRVHARHW